MPQGIFGSIRFMSLRSLLFSSKTLHRHATCLKTLRLPSPHLHSIFELLGNSKIVRCQCGLGVLPRVGCIIIPMLFRDAVLGGVAAKLSMALSKPYLCQYIPSPIARIRL